MRSLKYAVMLILAGWVVFSTVMTVRGFRAGIEKVTTIGEPVKPDTTFVGPEMIDEVITESTHPKKPGIIERVTSTEVQPDSVIIAKREQPDSTMSPTVVPSEPIELPDWGMQKVVKSGRTLEVIALKKDGTEAQKLYYSLPEEESDFTLTSGESPATMRTKRTWEVVDLKVELLLAAGAGGVTGAVVGPVGVNVTPNTQLAPVLMMGPDGTSVGVSVQLDF